MTLSRAVRPLVATTLLLAIPTACIGGGSKSETADTTVVTASQGPRPAPNVDPCVLSAEEIKKATGFEPAGPGAGSVMSCTYSLASKKGDVGRLEIRVKPWVTDAGIVALERDNRPDRAAVELENTGQAAVAFEADAVYPDVPAFVMTNTGLASINWQPGAEPGKDDTKLVVTVAKAIAKKLEVPPVTELPTENPAETPATSVAG